MKLLLRHEEFGNACPTKGNDMTCRYARTCPTYKNQCKPSKGEESTGTLNILNGNTTAVYYEPSAPIYFLIGNAGAAACSSHWPTVHTCTGSHILNAMLPHARAGGTVKEDNSRSMASERPRRNKQLKGE